MTKEECIRLYFDSWLKQDNCAWDMLFSEDVDYSECYGPCYHSLSMLKKWFAQWNQFGKVLEWEIQGFIQAGNQMSVSWYFHTIYEGEEDAFDGVSIVSFDETGKMKSVKEYQSTLPHVTICLK